MIQLSSGVGIERSGVGGKSNAGRISKLGVTERSEKTIVHTDDVKLRQRNRNVAQDHGTS